MGGWMSQLWWGGDPNTVNPLSGLTIRDVYLVQKSWTPIYANPAATGIELFTRLFRTFPETKEFFRMLKNIPEEELRQSHQFKAHVINLMSSLNLAVVNLNQPEVVAAMMNRLGESHGRRRIQEKHFNVLKEIIIDTFTEVFRISDEMTLYAWNKTIDFLYKHIFETLNEDETR